jgi:hypothetical protein
MTEALSSQSPNSLADGMAAVAAGMTVPEELRGVHTTIRLEPPTEVSVYGRFAERLDYTRGCVLDKELLSNPGLVLTFWLTAEDRPPRFVTIGRTPQGLQIPDGIDPGTPGEFLLIAQEDKGTNPSARYLDRADLAGVLAVNNQRGILFAGNPDRQRQLQLPGTVDQLTGYRQPVSRSA